MKKDFKKYDYISWINSKRMELALSVKDCANKSNLSANQLSRVLNYKTNLTREQAFFVGQALQLTPPQMEHLALLVVYSRAETEAFKKHIRNKLEKITKIEANFSWNDYIKSTLPRR